METPSAASLFAQMNVQHAHFTATDAQIAIIMQRIQKREADVQTIQLLLVQDKAELAEWKRIRETTIHSATP